MARSVTHTFHKKLPANTEGRDFFVGDIHGKLDALLLRMDEAAFDPAQDRIISVGDLIDRGQSSYEVLKLTKEPWFHAVRGNHETMLLDSQDHISFVHWLENGGRWFLDLDGEKVLDCFAMCQDLPLAITLDTPDGEQIGVCHAEWPGGDWAQVETHMHDPIQQVAMLWGRQVLSQGIHKRDHSAQLTVHGHTPISSIRKQGTALFIDTGCVHGGTLTLIERDAALAVPSSTGRSAP